MADILVDIISIISLSGFSGFAESIIGKLGFTSVLRSMPLSDAVVFCLVLTLMIKPKNLIISLKNLSKSFTKKIHPNAVVSVKYKKKTVSNEDADYASLHLLSMICIQLILAFILSFEASDVLETLILSAALLGNSGWILLLFGHSSLTAGYSLLMKLLMCAAMILGRAVILPQIKRVLHKVKHSK